MVKQKVERGADPARTVRAQALLDAAETLLEQGGVNALSARAVAERAGVNKGLVFYYWGSTTGLFEQVLTRYYERHKASLAEAFLLEGPLRARFHHVVDVYLDFMDEHDAYARIVQQQIASGGAHLPLVKKHLQEVLSLTTEMLAPLTPKQGPTSAKHFHVSLSAVVINWVTYGPVLLGEEASSRAMRAERRQHVHWVVDAWLDKLEAG
ncbi:MAG: TetR/AcrR family transcriptional regulator [Sandaracinaceae bacterium]